MKIKDFTLIDQYTDADGHGWNIYDLETPNLYFIFDMERKTKIVYSYMWINSEGEGHEDNKIHITDLGTIIQDLDK